MCLKKVIGHASKLQIFTLFHHDWKYPRCVGQLTDIWLLRSGKVNLHYFHHTTKVRRRLWQPGKSRLETEGGNAGWVDRVTWKTISSQIYQDHWGSREYWGDAWPPAVAKWLASLPASPANHGFPSAADLKLGTRRSSWKKGIQHDINHPLSPDQLIQIWG